MNSSIFLLFLFAGLSGFSQSPDDTKDLLVGTWYISEYDGDKGIFTKEKSPRPEFVFSSDQTVTFTHCTDMCGCLAVTYEGTWELDKEKIIIHYSKKWDPFYGTGKRTYSNIDSDQKIKLQELNSDILVLKNYWPD